MTQNGVVWPRDTFSVQTMCCTVYTFLDLIDSLKWTESSPPPPRLFHPSPNPILPCNGTSEVRERFCTGGRFWTSYRVASEDWESSKEQSSSIERQILVTRGVVSCSSGFIRWRGGSTEAEESQAENDQNHINDQSKDNVFCLSKGDIIGTRVPCVFVVLQDPQVWWGWGRHFDSYSPEHWIWGTSILAYNETGVMRGC